jgi:hypothetical protein
VVAGGGLLAHQVIDGENAPPRFATSVVVEFPAGFACCFCNLLATTEEFGREFIEAFNRFCSLNDPGNYCCTINWRAATSVSALGWHDRFRSGWHLCNRSDDLGIYKTQDERF